MTTKAEDMEDAWACIDRKVLREFARDHEKIVSGSTIKTMRRIWRRLLANHEIDGGAHPVFLTWPEARDLYKTLPSIEPPTPPKPTKTDLEKAWDGHLSSNDIPDEDNHLISDIRDHLMWINNAMIKLDIGEVQPAGKRDVLRVAQNSANNISARIQSYLGDLHWEHKSAA